MKTIEFLRHAESSANAGLPTSDPGDIPLTEAGRIAAEAAARDYDGPPPDLIVVSPFRRAQETSAPFRKRFPTAAVEEWPVQEFTYLNPACCLATTTADRLPLVEAYWKNATCNEVDGPGAESFHQFLLRVESTLHKLRERPKRAILVISHEIFIKAAMWLETGATVLLPLNVFENLRSLSRSQTSAGGSILRFLSFSTQTTHSRGRQLTRLRCCDGEIPCHESAGRWKGHSPKWAKNGSNLLGFQVK